MFWSPLVCGDADTRSAAAAAAHAIVLGKYLLYHRNPGRGESRVRCDGKLAVFLHLAALVFGYVAVGRCRRYPLFFLFLRFLFYGISFFFFSPPRSSPPTVTDRTPLRCITHSTRVYYYTHISYSFVHIYILRRINYYYYCISYIHIYLYMQYERIVRERLHAHTHAHARSSRNGQTVRVVPIVVSSQLSYCFFFFFCYCYYLLLLYVCFVAVCLRRRYKKMIYSRCRVDQCNRRV